MTVPTAKPDGILVPRPFLPGALDPHVYFKKKFRPILGIDEFDPIISFAQKDQYFLTATTAESLCYPTFHPLFPKERYQWWVVAEDRKFQLVPTPYPVRSYQDRPDAIKFGWLRDEQKEESPSYADKATMLKWVQDRDLKWQTMVKRQLVLVTLGESRDAAEREELTGIERDIERMGRDGPSDIPRFDQTS